MKTRFPPVPCVLEIQNAGRGATRVGVQSEVGLNFVTGYYEEGAYHDDLRGIGTFQLFSAIRIYLPSIKVKKKSKARK